jgi:hypothetical protein
MARMMEVSICKNPEGLRSQIENGGASKVRYIPFDFDKRLLDIGEAQQ